MSLQIWLPLNGNIDNYGLSSSTVFNSGATIDSSGKIGSCLSFTSGNYLGIDSSNTNNHKYSPISISLWFYPTQTDSSERYIIDCYESGGCGLCWQNQKINWQAYISSAYRQCWSSTTLALNTWHNIIGTYDGYTLKCYIDGILSQSLSITGSISYNSTTPWEIGGNPGPSSFASGNLIGKLNDIRIYDGCLSSREAKEISKGLILHYKLSNDFEQPGTNLALGANHGSCASESSPATWGAHKYWATLETCDSNDPVPFTQKTVMHFDYNTSYGSGGGGSVYPSQSFYVHPNTTYCYSCYFKANDNFSNASQNLLYHYEYNSSGTLLTEFGVWSSSRMQEVGNGWYRCWGTFTTNASCAKLTLPYYNYPGHSCIYEMGGLQLEKGDHMTPYINQQFRNSDPNLVSYLTAGGQTSISGGTVITSGTSADTYFYLHLTEAMQLNQMYKLSCYASGITNSQSWLFPVAAQSNTGPGQLEIKNGYNELIFMANSTCVNGGTNIILDDTSRPSTMTSCSFWDFRLSKIDTRIYDCSGYNNDGKYYGSTSLLDTSGTNAKYNKYLYFTSGNVGTYSDFNTPAFIKGDLALTNPSAISVSFWLKYDSAYGNSGVFCLSTNNIDSGSAPSDYTSGTIHEYDTHFRLNNSAASACADLTLSCPQTWNHIVITYDGTTAKEYLNGSIYTTSTSISGALGSCNYLYIGLSYAGGCYRKVCAGYSDFRIYATALSEDDVKELYNTSASIDNEGNLYARELVEQ